MSKYQIHPYFGHHSSAAVQDNNVTDALARAAVRTHMAEHALYIIMNTASCSINELGRLVRAIAMRMRAMRSISPDCPVVFAHVQFP